jgi:hypothetical protein
MTIWRLMDGVSGRPGVGSSGTQPPAAGASFSGNYLAGTMFEVTQGGLWFQGFWWWVPATTSQTGPQEFALWQILTGGVGPTGVLVPGSTVTSGTLTAGAMNFVPLATPIPLSPNCGYMAATGFVCTTGFPISQNQFTTGDPYSAGITNGPLFAFPTGSFLSIEQGEFSSTLGADPTAAMPASPFASSNFWVDVQVTDAPPGGASYRLWPNMPTPLFQSPDTANNFTLAAEFELSGACNLSKIWFYSQAGATQLPTETGIWAISGTSLVPGTHQTSPSWSGAAGSGWVSTPYTGVTLSPGVKYKVSVFNGAGSPNIWNVSYFSYWGTGPGAGGITAGPLSAPDITTATSPGQDTFNLGATFTYPASFDSSNPGDNYWVDVEVTPVAAPAAGNLLLAAFP